MRFIVRHAFHLERSGMPSKAEHFWFVLGSNLLLHCLIILLNVWTDGQCNKGVFDGSLIMFHVVETLSGFPPLFTHKAVNSFNVRCVG